MTKSTITRVQLIKKAQEQIAFCRHTKITGEGLAHVNQCAALFEIALAAMDCEPVAWRWRRGQDTRWHLASSGDLAGEVEPLYRHAQQPVVPDGWVMVPKEPTPEILASITEAIRAMRGSAATYARVLAAAPQPQSAQQNIPEIIPGWIPVSERMPEDEQEVIVQTHSGWRYVSFYDAHSRLFFDSPDGDIEHILVTHWMPLPAAPQEVK